MPRTSDNQNQTDVNETDIDALEATVASNTTAASNAQTTATNASTTASAAQTTANTASTAATNASTAATNAQTTANAASTKLTNVSQAELDLLSGVSAGTVTASKVATFDGSSALKAVTFAESVNGAHLSGLLEPASSSASAEDDLRELGMKLGMRRKAFLKRLAQLQRDGVTPPLLGSCLPRPCLVCVVSCLYPRGVLKAFSAGAWLCLPYTASLRFAVCA